MRLILASSSPRRRALIASLGVDFSIIKPDIDESRDADESPVAYVRRLSTQKADAVAATLTATAGAAVLAADTSVILAADTTGIHDGEILGKPESAEEARAMLRRLRGQAHIVCTGFTVLDAADGRRHTDHVQTVVHMRDYSDDEIDAYIATGDPFDKAGSYAIQHADFHPVARIEGDYNNVVGLPLSAVRAVLVDFGFNVR